MVLSRRFKFSSVSIFQRVTEHIINYNYKQPQLQDPWNKPLAPVLSVLFKRYEPDPLPLNPDSIAMINAGPSGYGSETLILCSNYPDGWVYTLLTGSLTVASTILYFI